VSSEPTLPAIAPGRANDEPAQPARSLRVLIAEDNRVNRFVVEKMLRKLGHEPHSVEDGREAVTAVEAGSFDAVLMDCQMPGMDGLEASREIRARVTNAPPIIAITAGSIKELREARAAGMSAFLPKPFSVETLGATLARLCPTPTDSSDAA
jgi:CheY-like chemotaxis protein